MSIWWPKLDYCSKIAHCYVVDFRAIEALWLQAYSASSESAAAEEMGQEGLRQTPKTGTIHADSTFTATGQPTRPTQPFIILTSIND